MSKEYTPELQKLYLEILLADPETYVRIQNIFDHKNFSRGLSQAAHFIHEYAQQYKSLPTVKVVNTSCKTTLSEIENIDEATIEWILDEFETFTRHKALERAIFESADLLEKGEYGQVETKIKNATQISLTKDMGISYWDNPRERLEAIINSNGQIKTGWPTLDYKLHGGFNRGELEIFAAPSNGGKSLFLVNLAVNWALAGLEVLFVTCEMSQELTAMRMDTIITGVHTRQVFKNIEDIELKLKMKSKGAAGIQLKYMPSGKTVNDLRAFVKEFQIEYKKKFDIVIVDYLDLLMPATVKVSPENLFVKDKYVSEELRNFAKEHDVVLCTAGQFNRSGTDETEFSQSHIAGGKSKIDTADNVFGIYSSRALKENGRYQLQLIKTRNSSGVGSKMDIGFDIDTLKLYDVGDTDTTETATNAVLDKIKRTPSTNNAPSAIDSAPKLRSLLDKVKNA